MTDKAHDTVVYLQLEADISESSYSPATVRKVKPVAMTQRRPTSQRPGTVLVKLTLRVPDAAFLPLRPEAVVVIPDSMTSYAPVEVEVGEPND